MSLAEDLSVPLVSIVLPTHNGSRYLRESIDSCLRQTHRNLELVIVNDGSTDETEEIALSYRDPRLVYAKHHPNAGLPRSLNVGFALAKGEYLTWTSDDNYYADEAIEVMLWELQQREPRVQFVYCDYDLIDAEGHTTRTRHVGTPASVRRKNGVGPCFLYTRHAARTVGAYNPQLALAEDYEYWLRIFFRFGISPVHHVLYGYRIHQESLSSTQGEERVRRVDARVRRSALRQTPTPRRLWEQTVGSPTLAVHLIKMRDRLMRRPAASEEPRQI